MTDWRTHAACADSDPNDWVWINSNKIKDARKAAPLKRICATCPVAAQCLDYALDNRIDHGVWGGTSERQRRRMLKGRRTPSHLLTV